MCSNVQETKSCSQRVRPKMKQRHTLWTITLITTDNLGSVVPRGGYWGLTRSWRVSTARACFMTSEWYRVNPAGQNSTDQSKDVKKNLALMSAVSLRLQSEVKPSSPDSEPLSRYLFKPSSFWDSSCKQRCYSGSKAAHLHTFPTVLLPHEESGTITLQYEAVALQSTPAWAGHESWVFFNVLGRKCVTDHLSGMWTAASVAFRRFTASSSCCGTAEFLITCQSK